MITLGDRSLFSILTASIDQLKASWYCDLVKQYRANSENWAGKFTYGVVIDFFAGWVVSILDWLWQVDNAKVFDEFSMFDTSEEVLDVIGGTLVTEDNKAVSNT